MKETKTAIEVMIENAPISLPQVQMFQGVACVAIPKQTKKLWIFRDGKRFDIDLPTL